ncbi:MAG TPA: substrate-binding domain-containing protein [Acidimicrobiales bacterium]|nr:substrate-binding domain-containing protein [Acidimicrobiales bacterium]
MQAIKQRRWAWLAVILAIGVTAAACGGDDDDEGSSGSESGGDLSGEINVSGSSTVEPISVAAGEAFMEDNVDVVVNVEGPGTGDGFESFCAGDTDISDASRAIDEEEAAACEENGIEYVELQIAFDGITVMTNPNNDAVECLSFADLYALIGPEAQGISTWAEGTEIATALGSTTALPDASLDLTGPGVESGTYDSFIELALSDIAEERGLPEDQIETTRDDYESSADDNTIITNIEASDTSLGWVGFAFAEEAGDQVKELGVSEEPGGTCVTPSPETISAGEYPLSRPLFIYVNTAKAEESDALAGFVDFYLDGVNGFVESTGYVTMPDDQLQAAVDAWEGR